MVQVILFVHTDWSDKRQCGFDEFEPELQRKVLERYKNIQQLELLITISLYFNAHLMHELSLYIHVYSTLYTTKERQEFYYLYIKFCVLTGLEIVYLL